MSKISELSPDGGSNVYELKDKDAQTKTLATPITVSGVSQTTVEGALSAINNKPTASIEDNSVDTYNVMLIAASEM